MMLLDHCVELKWFGFVSDWQSKHFRCVLTLAGISSQPPHQSVFRNRSHEAHWDLPSQLCMSPKLEFKDIAVLLLTVSFKVSGKSEEFLWRWKGTLLFFRHLLTVSSSAPLRSNSMKLIKLNKPCLLLIILWKSIVFLILWLWFVIQIHPYFSGQTRSHLTYTELQLFKTWICDLVKNNSWMRALFYTSEDINEFAQKHIWGALDCECDCDSEVMGWRTDVMGPWWGTAIHRDLLSLWLVGLHDHVPPKLCVINLQNCAMQTM